MKVLCRNRGGPTVWDPVLQNSNNNYPGIVWPLSVYSMVGVLCIFLCMGGSTPSFRALSLSKRSLQIQLEQENNDAFVGVAIRTQTSCTKIQHPRGLKVSRLARRSQMKGGELPARSFQALGRLLLKLLKILEMVTFSWSASARDM